MNYNITQNNKVILLYITVLMFLYFPCARASNSNVDNVKKEYIQKIFTQDLSLCKGLFHKSFFRSGLFVKLKPIVKEYKSELGELKKVIKVNNDFEMHFEKGKAQCRITLIKSKLIRSIWFGNWAFFDNSIKLIIPAFKRLQGEGSVTIIRDDTVVLASYNSDIPLAIASSFKLYVLKALENYLTKYNIHASTNITLDEKNKSLPSGILHTWPDKSPISLKKLANLMISISDNTAADNLILYLGRERVERAAPTRMRPFLTTAELFTLKWGVQDKVVSKYIHSGLIEKRKILENIKHFDRNTIYIGHAPTLIKEIEWHATTKELCHLIYSLRDNSSITLNPGFASPSNWHFIGYIGGSEPGVQQFTYLIRKEKNGSLYAISATLNDPENTIDPDEFTQLTTRLLIAVERDSFINSGN